MVKNILIIVLVIIAIGEGVLLLKQPPPSMPKTAMTQNPQQKNMPPAGPNARGRGGPPMMLNKGMNLKTSPVFKYAYQIAPGELSSSTQKAITGFNISTQKQIDGSITVSLTPKDSEYQSQQYTIKTDQVLYFIEQTPADDKADQDKDLNYRDDYGIIVDKSGVIQ